MEKNDVEAKIKSEIAALDNSSLKSYYEEAIIGPRFC
jgi:hypothetical protein